MSTLVIPSAIETRFAQVARVELGPAADHIGPATRLDELGDSLDLVGLLSAVEDAFGVRITDAQSQRLRNVGDLLTLLAESQGV
jgi:acyl carrier protein